MCCDQKGSSQNTRLAQHSEAYPSNRIKDKSHTVISVNIVKAFDKLQHSLMVNILNNLGIELNFFSLIKCICEKPPADITPDGERLNYFPLRSGTSQEC